MVEEPERSSSEDGIDRRVSGPRSEEQASDEASRSESATEQRVPRIDAGPPDTERAERVIRFIESLTVPSGEGQGGRFKLRDFQKQFIYDVYSPHSYDERKRLKRTVRRAIFSMARKNGKTALIAALVLVHLCGPESITNCEIYSAANDRKQAAQVYKVAAQMVKAHPILSQVCKCIDSTKRITCQGKGSFYEAMSAESGTKHGLNPTLVIYDELAQSKSRDLYDVLDTSMGAQFEPLFIVISTQSNDPEHILSKLIDDGLNANDPRIVCHLYEIPEDKDVFDSQYWKLANPALGDFRSLEDLRALADKASRYPAEEPRFRNLYANQRVSQAASLISKKEWMACVGDARFEKKEKVYLALDMSAVVDLTALVMAGDGEKTKVQPFIWKPLELLKDHSDRDFGSGNSRYVEWHKDGHLLSSPGRSIDPAVIAAKIIELWQTYEVLGLAYDRWRIADLRREFDHLGFETWEDKGSDSDKAKPGVGLRIVHWGQGYKDMAPAIDALEIEVAERKLIHSSNPVLNWNMGNAIATMDPAGNRKLDKEKATFRIDGAQALTMVVGLKSRDRAGVKLDIAGMLG